MTSRTPCCGTHQTTPQQQIIIGLGHMTWPPDLVEVTCVRELYGNRAYSFILEWCMTAMASAKNDLLMKGRP